MEQECTTIHIVAPGRVQTAQGLVNVVPRLSIVLRTTHSMLSGDLSSLGLGQLHLLIS